MTPVLPRDPAVRAKWLAVAAVGGAAFTAFLVGLKSPDGFHLLALGRALVRAGGLPAMEPFVYPLADQPFIGSSWLSGLLLYASHALAGDAGPVVLAAALGAATLAVMARDATREARSAAALAAALLPVALAIAVHRPRVAPRPEAVAFLCLAATLLLVRRWENGEARRLWLLPALFLMWANAHQSVAAGAAILGVTLVVALAHRAVARRGAPPAPDLKPLALWSGAALLASLLSPSGWTQFRTAAGFVLSSVAPPSPGAGGGAYSMLRTMVMELGPIPREDWLGPFGALTCLSAVAFAAGFNRSTPRQLAVAAGAFVLAVSAWRYESLAAIVVAPMAGRHLALAVERLGTRRGVAVATLALSAAGLVAAAAWAVATPYARFGVAVEPWGLPVRTAEYL
ncbi:MAG: hypothetical protein HY906_03305, partial [Deltaproteobacteria bacterium]|nr:hypothetical protein [Deltaproteobacteria bacterium]